MGQTLEKPISKKESTHGVSSPKGQAISMVWSSSCMQGWRNGMEDAHITITELPSPWGSVAMFGVLDGHGGEQVAKFCERHMPKDLHSRLCDARPWASGQGQASTGVPEGELRQAMTDCFHEMDELLRSGNFAAELKALTNPPCRELARPAPPKTGPVDCNMVGCTCNIVCITPEFILCGNAGDSRAVLCRGGKAVPLSEDHKPNHPIEEGRIRAAGGYIEAQPTSSGTQYRVNGNLNLSRALGDLEYKKDRSLGPEAQIISGTPDFICEKRHPDDEFIVICCDGVWDVKENQEVVNFVRQRLPDTADDCFQAPESIMEELLDDCLSPDLRATKGLGGDNMTSVVIRFCPPGISYHAASNGSAQGGRYFSGTTHAPASSHPRVETGMAKARSQAHLLSVQVEASLPSAGGGTVVARFSLEPSSIPMQDIFFGFNEVTAQLELCLAGESRSQKFNLEAKIPRGAELCSDPQNVSVKFFPEKDSLKVTLPWKWKGRS